MRMLKTMGIAVSVLALFATARAGAGDGLITVLSERSVAEAAEAARSIIEEKGLTFFFQVDHAANARSAGLSLRPTVVLVFGNPKIGTPLMEAAPSLAVDLPQKLLITAVDGETRILYNDPGYLAGRHGLSGDDPRIRKIRGVLESIAAGAAGR